MSLMTLHGMVARIPLMSSGPLHEKGLYSHTEEDWGDIYYEPPLTHIKPMG